MHSEKPDLHGRSALVTGGASGVGRATVQRLVERGAAVIVADVADDGEQIAAGLGARYLHLDVSNEQAWAAAVEGIADTTDHLDLLHLNAGVSTPPPGAAFGDDPLRWLTPEGYRRTRGVNVDGVVHGLLACLPLLRGTSGSDVVVTGSIASVEPMPADPFYSLSKYAITGFVRSLAPTLATLGIRAQVVCLGGVDTAILAPDVRIEGRTFASPFYAADAVLTALADGAPGDIWVAPREGVEPTTYTYAPIR